MAKVGLMLCLTLAAATLLSSAVARAQTALPGWGANVLRQEQSWYASDEARRLAATVVLHQSAAGGWPKNTDLFSPPARDADPGQANTIDNNATTLPLAFLARVIAAGDASEKEAFDRGADYLLAAQYPGGGWPQYYPLRGGYHDQITFNDDAMIRVMRLLRDIASGEAPYDFVEPARRQRAAEAVGRGVATILRTQVRQNGRPTVWCAQHDAATLQPAWGRRFEPPSLSASESVGVIRFLMSVDQPTPEMVAAVEGAVDWLRSAAIHDVRIETVTTDGKPDRKAFEAPGAEPVWARFYALDTNAPIFMGRDSIARATLAEIEQERRAGYAYYGTWPQTLLSVDYPAWQARLGSHAPRVQTNLDAD